MQIHDRLHCLSSAASNAYLFEDNDGWVLFDTGMWGLIDPVRYVTKLGHGADVIKHIVVTHADIDHIGGLHKIQKQTGAQVYAGAKSAELITKGHFPQHGKLFIDTTSRLFFRVKPTSAEHIQTVTDGDQLPLLGGLHVHDAPGHTADHMAFYSPSTGILISGDAIFALGKKLRPSLPSISLDYEQAKASAIKLANLSPAIFCCGHGTPFSHDMSDVMGLLHTLRDPD